MDVPDDEDEETILEYAEYHQLASNSFAGESLDGELSALWDFLEPPSPDDATLFQIPRNQPTFPLFRLPLDKQAALLLHEVNQRGDEPDPWIEIAKHTKIGRRNPRKLDSPLLKTDPDADLCKFKARVSVQLRPEDEFLPSEPLDNENDEGLAWPARMLTLPTERTEELDHEKLVMSRADILCAMNAMSIDWTSEDNEKLLESQRSYTRTQSANLLWNTTLAPISPPLSPVLFSEFEPFVPSSPGCVIPLLSDPVSLLSADQRHVEEQIFLEDNLGGDILLRGSAGRDNNGSMSHENEDDEHNADVVEFPELESIPSSEHFPEIPRQRKEDLHIDNCLTPRRTIPSLPKIVSFSEHVDMMLLDECSDEESLRADPRNAGIMKWDSEVEGALIAASEKSNHKLEREQLQEAATTKKVDVPTLDFNTPRLPWKEPEGLRLTKKIEEYHNNLIWDALEFNWLPAKIHGLHRLQENLRWAPFPADLAKVALVEELERDGSFDGVVADPGKVITSGDVIYSKHELKCLEDVVDDDDEELEPADFVAELDRDEETLEAILARRKRQLAYDAGDGGHQAKQQKLVANVHDGGIPQKRPAETTSDNIFGNLDFYCASSVLDNFMEARGKKKPKLTGSDYFDTSKRLPTGKQHQLPAQSRALAPLWPKSVALPLPTVNAPINPTPFIVSTTLMQIRPIIKAITCLYPTAQLIERDFFKHNESLWMKGSVKRSPVVSALASEADVILSPSIGVVMTTLAKIKQKPLPGQTTKVKIVERIEGVSQRYARVIVFVSEGSADDSTRHLNGQDAMAYAEFVGFCSTQECTVTPVYVPGGPQALGTWIASAMVKHGIHDGSQASVMEDETVWELFLRRCGMNAYAAQSVIAAMRAPEGVNSRSPNKAGLFGLPGFVQMDHAERMRQFESLVGGTRVLERVSAAIDTPWRPPTPAMVPGVAPRATYGHVVQGSRFS